MCVCVCVCVFFCVKPVFCVEHKCFLIRPLLCLNPFSLFLFLSPLPGARAFYAFCVFYVHTPFLRRHTNARPPTYPRPCHAASADFSARLWDAVTGNQVHEFVHKHIVKTVHFAADRSKLATAGHEGILRIFDVASPGSAPTEVDCEGGGACFLQEPCVTFQPRRGRWHHA